MSNFGDYEIIVPTYTPFDNEGAVNFSVLKSYANYLRQHEIPTLFINGSTAESWYLSAAERRDLLAAWLKEIRGEMRSIAHVGHASVVEAEQLAAHAESLKVDAIAAIAPFFLSAPTEEGLLRYLVRVAKAAPKTPFYFYHIPTRTGCHVEMLRLIENIDRQIPNFGGVKYTHNDMAEYRACIEKWGDRYQFYLGRDEMFAEGLVAGSKGAIGTTFNFIPQVFRAIVQNYHAGNTAQVAKLSQKVNDLIAVLFEYDFFASGKVLLDSFGVPCGDVRPPLVSITPEASAEFLQKVEQLDILDMTKA